MILVSGRLRGRRQFLTIVPSSRRYDGTSGIVVPFPGWAAKPCALVDKAGHSESCDFFLASGPRFEFNHAPCLISLLLSSSD